MASHRDEHNIPTGIKSEISTKMHSVPSSYVVRRIMMKYLSVPLIVLACGIAITAYLAFGDWRWLVVLLMLIFVVGFMLFTFAWICAISNPIAVRAVQSHQIILRPDQNIVVMNETGSSYAIALRSIIEIEAEDSYIIIKFTPEQPVHSKGRKDLSELIIPVSAFHTTDDARIFYTLVYDCVSTLPHS